MQHALSLMSVDSEDRQKIETALASAVEFEPANPMAHNLLGVSKVCCSIAGSTFMINQNVDQY